MKVCSCCKIEKPIDEFFRKANGFQSWCKSCKYENTKAWKERNKLKIKESRALYYSNNIDKELHKMKEWKDSNRDYVNQYARDYALNNKDKRTALQMKRHVRKVSTEILSGDEWNDFYIEEIYNLSKIRTSITDIKWHVDHIIPLQGKLVTGLHVWNNLQLLPASLNCRKNNSF